MLEFFYRNGPWINFYSFVFFEHQTKISDEQKQKNLSNEMKPVGWLVRGGAVSRTTEPGGKKSRIGKKYKTSFEKKSKLPRCQSGLGCPRLSLTSIWLTSRVESLTRIVVSVLWDIMLYDTIELMTILERHEKILQSPHRRAWYR